MSRGGAGPERVSRLLQTLQIEAQRSGIRLPVTSQTPYVNTIPIERQPPYPGDLEIERRIKSIIRWNAMAMVVEANQNNHGIGGAHFDLRLGRHAVRGRVQSFFPRSGSPLRRRPDLLPGALGSGHLRAQLRRGTPAARPLAQVPPGALGRVAVLSASLADERLLAVRHGLDGTGADPGDLSGALYPLSRKIATCSNRPTARSGVSSATARPTSPNRWARLRWPRARSWTT